MTEDEAKKKWCPFVRVGGFGGGNRDWQTDILNSNMAHKVCCIASDCMMWEECIEHGPGGELQGGGDCSLKNPSFMDIYAPGGLQIDRGD